MAYCHGTTAMIKTRASDHPVNDADCDGVPTADDCNDLDTSLLYNDGSSSDCPAYSCTEYCKMAIPLEMVPTGFGKGSTAIEAECDMTTDGGGYTSIMVSVPESQRQDIQTTPVKLSGWTLFFQDAKAIELRC